MGARFRLKASFDISGFDARTQVVSSAPSRNTASSSRARRQLVHAGVSDAGWPSDHSELQSIAGSNFEAVDTAPLMINANSAQAVQLPRPAGGTGVAKSAIAQVYDAGVVLATWCRPTARSSSAASSPT
jgi:hypothetical protein